MLINPGEQHRQPSLVLHFLSLLITDYSDRCLASHSATAIPSLLSGLRIGTQAADDGEVQTEQGGSMFGAAPILLSLPSQHSDGCW